MNSVLALSNGSRIIMLARSPVPRFDGQTLGFQHKEDAGDLTNVKPRVIAHSFGALLMIYLLAARDLAYVNFSSSSASATKTPTYTPIGNICGVGWIVGVEL